VEVDSIYRLGVLGRARILWQHMVVLPGYLSSLIRAPVLALLAKDAAYGALAAGLERAGVVEGVVLSCTSWNSQPLWIRMLDDSRTHMVWYSQNIRPVFIRCRCRTPSPMVPWMAVGCHWVWTPHLASICEQQPPDSV
jgi:hypothetical protein